MTAGGENFYDSALRNTNFIKETNENSPPQAENFPVFGTRNTIFLKEMLLL